MNRTYPVLTRFSASDLSTLQMWTAFYCAILAVKLIAYLLDPNVMFFKGDSMAYINTALHNVVPPDRSYLYGVFIGVLTSASDSLNSLVIAQVVASSISCLLLARILTEFFGANMKLALFAALICAIEPIQLLYERYVMTEAFSLLFFAIFIYSLLAFMKRGDWRAAAVATLAGFLMIKLRFALLPVYVLGLLTALICNSLHGFAARKQSPEDRGRHTASLAAASRWLIVAATFIVLQVSFSQLQDRYARQPHTSISGFFLMSAWAPLLAENEIPFGPDLDEVLKDMPCELDDIWARNANLWYEGCLRKRLTREFPNLSAANEYAKEVVWHLLLHDPFGIAKMAFLTWTGYLDQGRLDRSATWSRASKAPWPQAFRKSLAAHYNHRLAEFQSSSNLTGRYFQAATYWYSFLVLFPLLVLPLLFWFKRQRRLANLLVGIYVVHLAFLVTVSTDSNIRYLHPLAWLSILLIFACWLALPRFKQPLRQPGSRD